MTSYQHETVKFENRIPAMIAILNHDQIDHYFPTEIFIPAHWHRSLEISWIEHAEVILQIGEQETRIKNDFTCVNSGVVHSLSCGEIKEDSKCIILLLSYEFLKQYCPDIDDIYFDMNKQKDHRPLKQLYDKLEKLYQSKEAYHYLKVTACLLEILQLLMKDYMEYKTTKAIRLAKNQDKIQNVLTYLHEHYQEDLSLTMMADQFHMSREHFSRQFHYYVGKTFRDYLFSYRLYKAYQDIVQSDLSIQDIARIHGFLNVKSFIHQFTKVYHETPMKYRKNINNLT